VKQVAQIFSVLSLLSLVGCANQWREADSDITGDQVMELLNQIPDAQTAGDGSDNGVSEALAYKDASGTAIYFAETPGSLGPVPAVLALDTLEFMNPNEDLWYGNIKKARIFFLDAFDGSTHKDSLIIGIGKDDSSEYTYYGMSGEGGIEDEEFVAELKGPNGTLMLRSWDVDGDDLTSVIQLRAYLVDSGGNEVYIGKISTLIGFDR
jgi:hypothetical protein